MGRADLLVIVLFIARPLLLSASLIAVFTPGRGTRPLLFVRIVVLATALVLTFHLLILPVLFLAIRANDILLCASGPRPVGIGEWVREGIWRQKLRRDLRTP